MRLQSIRFSCLERVAHMTLQVFRWSSMRLRPLSLLALSLLLLAAPSACTIRFEIVENTEADETIGELNFTESDITVLPCPSHVRVVGSILKTAVKFDREEIIQLNDTRDSVLHCTAQLPGKVEDILIHVLDVNDNVPRFSELDPVHVLNVTENFNIPNPILRLEPLDLDNGTNGTVHFNITTGNEENFFYIGPPLEYEGPDTDRLELFFNRSVDHETHQTFNLTIFMHDHGTPPLNFTQIIIVDINDLNDENPRFITSVFTFEVEEHHTVGPEHPFGEVVAVDNDSIPSVMEFSLINENVGPTDAFDYVGLNIETGQLYLKRAIDYEDDLSLHHIAFSIEVHEVGMGAKVDIARVNINIKDVNEESPEITIISSYPISVSENDQGPVRIIVFKVKDSDGVNSPIIEVDPPLLFINRTLNGLRIIEINETLDREVLDSAIFNITVYDKGTPSLSTNQVVELSVLDENDNPPTFTDGEYNAITIENVPFHHVVAKVEATDPDAGENGSVSYTIAGVSPAIAEPWFSIDPQTGAIRVESTLNYTLASSVSIMVSAKDNGTVMVQNATTVVHITISPSITFKPWSYQEHCLPQHVKIQDTSTKIYLEFRTGQKNSLLLYEHSPQGETFVLKIQDGQILAIVGNDIQSRFNGFDVSTDRWISVQYDFGKKTLNVSYTDEEGSALKPTLEEQETIRCDDTTDSTSQTFYVGGINAFSQLQNASGHGNFVGMIRNLFVGSMLVNLGSPVREENTVRGALFTSKPVCGSEMTCDGPHHSGCVDYDFESHCICSGGFNSHACNKQENYAPIQLSSSSTMKVAVDYALFADLLQRSGLVNPTSALPIATTNSGRRRRRSLSNTSNYQLVEFQFRLLRESTGTLLYSRTSSSIHNLEITRESSPQYTIRYTISSQSQVHVHIAKQVDFDIGELYTVSINMNTTHVHVSFNGTKETMEWNNVAPFIEYPSTEISIGGGAENSKSESNFTGCIAQLSVNGIKFPLNGLVENNDPSIQIVGASSSSSVSTTCDLCQLETPPCSDPFQCTSNSDGYTCECPKGQTPSEGKCIDAPTNSNSPPEALNPPSGNELTLYYIAAGAGGAVVLTAALVATVCCICCRRRKKKNEKTYHVGGDQRLPHQQLGSGTHQRSRGNSYTDITRRPSTCNSEPGYGMVSRHNHDCSSSTTCNDEDTESHIQHMIRSKSSTSGETGFHTASERDDQRSLPRMEDSGNEKDTDYSPFETESDDSQSYVEMQSPIPMNMHHSHAKARPDLHLQQFSSPSGSAAPVSGIGAPLTPKEKKFITPLRPDSHSELGEETDLDTDFSSTVLARRTVPFSRGGYRGGSLKLSGRPDSGMSGHHQWYKSSTSSDTERERKRAEAGRAYYPPNPYQSFRRTRATSASSAQQAEATELVSPLPKCASLTPPLLQGPSRSKRDHVTITPPISPLTNFSHRHHQRIASPHIHQKERELSNTSEYTSAAVLSRSQPLKMHHPFFNRQCSESPRVPPHLTTHRYVPSYMRSYSEESTRKEEEKKFVDLGSVRTNCDPIQYWEGQRRMMANVDHQVDAFPVLSESFTPFEDSSIGSRQSGPQHQSFASQGGGEGTAEALDVGGVHDCDTESVATGTTLKGSESESRILFPSADCSDEYRCTPRMMTTVLSQSDSNLLQHSGSVPPSQGTFEV